MQRTIVPSAVSGVQLIPVPHRDGMERLDTVLAWKVDSQNQVLRHYMRLAEELLGSGSSVL